MKTSFRFQQNLQNSLHMSNQDQFTAPKHTLPFQYGELNLLWKLIYWSWQKYARYTSQSKSRWWSSRGLFKMHERYTKETFQRQFTLTGRGLLEQIILTRLIAETILLKAHYPRVKNMNFFNFLVKPNLNWWAY